MSKARFRISQIVQSYAQSGNRLLIWSLNPWLKWMFALNFFKLCYRERTCMRRKITAQELLSPSDLGWETLGVGTKTKIKMKAVPQKNGTTGIGRVCGTDPWWVGQVHLPPLSSRLWCPRGRGDRSNSILRPMETSCTHIHVCVCPCIESTNYSFSYLSENTSTKWRRFGWT